MRSLPLFLLLLPAIVLAPAGHADPSRAAAGWDGGGAPLPPGDDVSFQEELEEGDGGGSGAETPPTVDLSPPEGAAEKELVDQGGNYKLTLPPGWEATSDPPEDEETFHRITIQRQNADGQTLASVAVVRWQVSNTEVFTLETPNDVLTRFARNNASFLDPIFGEGAHQVRRPREVREDILLGDAEKSGAYEYRGLTLEQEKKIQEAETLRRRGEKVEVPTYPDTVLRGRLAMIAPYVYLVRAEFGRDVADNAELLAEYDKVMDSWEFLSTKALPPPLESDKGPFGDTRPANPELRKKNETTVEANKGDKVVAELEIDYILPPGFEVAARVRNPYNPGEIFAIGENLPLQVVAQDDKNGWVWITVFAANAKLLDSNEKFTDRKQVFETWISNFAAKARNTGRMPSKPKKIRIGNLSGDGCELEGTIDRFKASEINMVDDKSGWRIRVEVKTRGSGAETFEDGLKDFLKKLRFRKK